MFCEKYHKKQKNSQTVAKTIEKKMVLNTKWFFMNKSFCKTTFDNIKQEKLKPVDYKPLTNDDLFNFINTFDLSSKRGIFTDFDNTKIYRILIHSKNNKLVETFLEKLKNDSLEYPKECHMFFCELYVFCCIYCINNDMNFDKFKCKLEYFYRNAKLISKYEIPLTTNDYINEFVCCMSNGNSVYETAIRLNWIKKHSKSGIVSNFNTLLYTHLMKIEPEFLFDFIKIIVTHNTISYTIESKDVVISFLNNLYKGFSIDKMCALYERLLKIVDDEEVRNVLCGNILKWETCSTNKKATALHDSILLEKAESIKEISELVFVQKKTLDFAIKKVQLLVVNRIVWSDSLISLEILMLLLQIHKTYKK